MYCHTEYGGFGSVAGKIEIEVKINHEGEVNRSVIHLHDTTPPSLPSLLSLSLSLSL